MGIELTDEQKKVVNFDDRLLIIKGAAGSGKTLVGLDRAHKMVNDRTYSLFDTEKKVVFLTYNNSLINELKDKYESYFGESTNSSIDFKTYDGFVYGMIKDMFLKTHPNYQIGFFNHEWYKEGQYRKFVLDSFKDTKYETSFIFDEFEYIMSNNFNKAEYLIVNRKNRKKRLLKSEREKFLKVLCEYRKMLSDDEKIDGLDMYNWFLRELESISKMDDMEEAKKNASELFEKLERIHSIIIDESQDLTRTKIKIMLKIIEIFREIKSLTFLYDVSQSLYDFTCFAGINSFKDIGIDGRKSVKTLSFSYRSTKQIHQCAYSLLSRFQEKSDKNELIVNPIFGQSDEGVKPFLVKFDSIDEEAGVFATIVKSFLSKKEYDPLDILVVPNDTATAQPYREALNKVGVESAIITPQRCKNLNNIEESARDFYKGKVRFSNTQNVKGLEAKIIFMLGTNNEFINFNKSDEEIAKCYYVQMTRAMEYLFIFSVGEPNKYIKSIDEKYLTEFEYDKNISVEDIIYSNTLVCSEHFQKNKVERYGAIKKNAETEMTEEIKKDEEKEKRIDTETKKIDKAELKIEGCIDYARNEMESLPEDVVRMIGMGLYHYKAGVDIDAAYFKFSKALEFTVRAIYKENGFGLGIMANELFLNKNYKKFIQELYRKKLIVGRNTTAHDEIKSQKDLDVLYNYIFKEKGLERFYNKFLSVENKEENKLVVERVGNLYTKGYKIKVGGSLLFSYLIDNEDYAVCAYKLKPGNYKMAGFYQESRGKKIYNIQKYQLID